MKTFINIFFIAFFLMFFSCKKEEIKQIDIIGLGGDKWQKGEIDDWLDANFTKPYNIEVKYRWDPSEFFQNRTFTPVELDNIKPFMQLVRSGVIDVFAEVAGQDFVKKHFPKQFALSGSFMYNVDGTVYAGIAESASTVLLLGLNEYDPTDREQIKRRLKLIFHELTHILHQKNMYPVEYKMVTPGGYTANWTQFNNTSARSLGFITAYGMGAPNEDVAELASIIISEGKAGYEAIIAAVPESGRALLRKKESILVNYFSNTWNIDIWTLANRLQDKINQLTPAPATELYSQLGTGNTYKTILIDMNSADLHPTLKSKWQSATEALITNGSGRRLHPKLALHFTSNNSVQIVAYYFTQIGQWSTPARLQYDIIPQANGTFKFSYFSGNGGGDIIYPHMSAFLQQWFNTASFKIDWAEGTPQGEKQGGLYQADDNSVRLIGTLGNLAVTASAWPFTYTALYDMLGTSADRSYKSLIIDTENSAQSSDFKTLWANAKASAISSGNRTLKELAISYGATYDQVQVALYYLSSAGVKSVARYNYNMRIDAKGIARFTLLNSDNNGAALSPAIKPLLDKYLPNGTAGVHLAYLSTSIFSPPANLKYGAFTRTDNSSLFLFGELSGYTSINNALWPRD